MPDVWFAIPVAASEVWRASETFARWCERGYRCAALIDNGSRPDNAALTIGVNDYRGWSWAVNRLASALMSQGVDWIVTGGADVWPDPDRTAPEIAAECEQRFGGTYGVMQPTGDKWGASHERKACVSPWIGREWCEQAYGNGKPLHEGYAHYYADGELMDLAAMRSRLWWRDDLCQFHDHYLRRHEQTPEHLQRWQQTVRPSRELYERRKAMGFPA